MFRWKVFEERNGKPYFLFHGLNRTKEVPLDTSLNAEIKKVVDGSRQNYYESGFHLFKDTNSLIRWSRKLKNKENRYAVKVIVKNIRTKDRSNFSILSSDLKVTSKAWKRKIPLTYFDDEWFGRMYGQ